MSLYRWNAGAPTPPTAGDLGNSNYVIKYPLLENLSAAKLVAWLNMAPMDGDIRGENGESMPFCTISGTSRDGQLKLLPVEFRSIGRSSNPFVFVQGLPKPRMRLSEAIRALGNDATYSLKNVLGPKPPVNFNVQASRNAQGETRRK